jgi:hypothetical protein
VKNALVILAVVLVFGQCTERSDTVEIITEDGVDVVLNRLEPYSLKGEPSTFSLEEEFFIDFEREDLGELGVDEVLDFDVDAEGNVYCVCTSQVFKFDPTGRFLLKFGRKGEGPGEFQEARRCRAMASGEFMLYDWMMRRLLLYSPEGEFLRQETFMVEEELWGSDVVVLDNGGYLYIGAPQDPEAAIRYFHLHISDADLGSSKRLPERIASESAFNSTRMNLLNRYIKYQVSGDKIFAYSQDNPEYELNIYDLEGNLLKKIRKEYRKVRLYEEYKQRRMEWFNKHPLSRIHKMEGYFPDHYAPISELYVDDQGRIYAATYELGDSPEMKRMDLLNADGVFIGSVFLRDAKKRKFQGDRHYSLYEKENGFQNLVVSRMIWR